MELSETKLKESVLRMLKKEFSGAWVYKTADRWKSGIPDLIICFEGRFYAAELKIGNNKAAPLQRYVLNKIRKAGGHTAVCKSVNQVRTLITQGGENDG